MCKFFIYSTHTQHKVKSSFMSISPSVNPSFVIL